MASETTNERNGVTSNETLLEILQVMKENNGARLSDIAEEVGVSGSTVHRHLTTLHENEYIVKDNNNVYYLGLRFLDLGGHSRQHHQEHGNIRRKIRAVAKETGEVAQLLAEEHGRGFFIYREAGASAVNTEARIGKRVYLHRNAAGKAILAEMSESRRDEIYDKWGFPAKTEKTITDRKTMEQEIERIQDREYAIDKGEHIPQLWSVGVAVSGPDEELIGGLSVAAPRHRMKGDWFDKELPDLLLGIANEVTLNVTYSY
jgi:DNA-binding IclR family transcriptional regulator